MNSLGAGLRKTSPQSLQATEYAREYREKGARRITRKAALNAGKRAVAAMGLKTAKIALLDLLFASTQSQDWTDEDVVPIIWPSNDNLARKLGISISTLKHHLNGLVSAGLISYSDGPTYQRRGRRDEQKKIIEATGIDLSPLAVRFAELTEMAEAAEYRSRQWKRYSDRRTVLRKEIQSLILSAVQEGLEGPWQHAQARLDVIREARASDLEELTSWVEGLEDLRTELEAAYNKALMSLNMHTAVSKFRPLLTTAENPYPESSNLTQPRANARESIPSFAYGEMALEIKPGDAAESEQAKRRPQEVLSADLQFISLPLVQEACPTLETFVPGIFDNWSALRETGLELCAAVGINPQVWREALAILGPDMAISALAVTIQKSEVGLVTNPGAYMRRLIQRGREGELHISRSLFGMAQARAGDGGAGEVLTEALAKIVEFPSSGSIHFSRHWADLVRLHAPKPTPDLDQVADAFRRWTKGKNIDLSSPNIERTFIAFCAKWKMN